MPERRTMLEAQSDGAQRPWNGTWRTRHCSTAYAGGWVPTSCLWTGERPSEPELLTQ